jgi:translation initiation factor IF-3
VEFAEIGDSQVLFQRRLAIPPNVRENPQRGGDRDRERGPRINEQIRITPIRVIGAGGEQIGVIPTADALTMAREQGFDLVEVAATERPPVCKIMDYGKYRYEQSRKQTKTKVHQQKLKEIRVRPKTGEHDIDTKLNQARKFLEHKDKVLLKVLFRGRELQHIEEGQRIMAAMLEKLADSCKMEKPPSMEGKSMTAMLAPKS